MVMKRKTLAILIGQAFASTALISIPATGSAQQAVERVEITGTNIRRVETETASPVLVITRDDIEKSGKASVGEYLQTLAVDSQGSVPASFGNGFAPGSAGISLRGLGAGSTLVLVNGRRIAPYGLADDGQKVFTDLSVIPMEAVDRVEILKDGASAIYGSDAIAGVVNIILRRDFTGTVGKVSFGTSKYHDGNQTRAAVTTGFGNLGSDRYNVFFNVEVLQSDQIFDRDRNRDWIGKGDIRPYGYSLPGSAQFLAGRISSGGAAAGSSPTGAVRPAGGLYTSLPGCSSFSQVTPQDPAGGCLWDTGKFRTMLPEQKDINLFGRGTWRIAGEMEAYAEAGYNNKKSEFQQNPSGVSGSWGFPGGPVNASSGPGATQLAATHPDNPLGVPAFLRYSTWDVGPRITNTENDFTRFVAGLRGKVWGWEYDTALLHSETSLHQERRGFIRYSVLTDYTRGTNVTGLNPGLAFYRIGVNAGLNPASLYSLLSPTISSDAKSKMDIIDAKASRDLMALRGGPLAVAIGAEFRQESTKLTPTTFTDQGDIVGLGFSAYDGKRNITAAYAEVLAPVLKSVELSAAVRSDSYSSGASGSSTTPKVGAKWTPVRSLALRGTYAEGFRAPNPAEAGTGGGLAAFTAARDPVRCPNGPGGPFPVGASASDCNTSIAIITTPNPNLQPEKSKSATLGAIWDPLPDTSISVDYWEIKRSNEINQQTVGQALAAGTSVVRDSSNNIPGVPNSGTLLAVSSPYINSSQTDVKGYDVDIRQRFKLGGFGSLLFDVKWVHLTSFLRHDPDGSSFEFAGTHGNCDVTNCMGTPKDRVNASVSWDRGDWRWTAMYNYRGPMQNKFFENDPAGCANAFADGTDAPQGCKIPAFYTVDVSFRWRTTKQLEVFGSIQNLFDKVAPLDPLTYGAISYNPVDISGAVGRFFTAGLKYRFN